MELLLLTKIILCRKKVVLSEKNKTFFKNTILSEAKNKTFSKKIILSFWQNDTFYEYNTFIFKN